MVFNLLDLTDLRCSWEGKALSTILSQKKVSKSASFLIPATQGSLRINIDYYLKHVKFPNKSPLPKQQAQLQKSLYQRATLSEASVQVETKRLADYRRLAMIRLEENGYV